MELFFNIMLALVLVSSFILTVLGIVAYSNYFYRTHKAKKKLLSDDKEIILNLEEIYRNKTKLDNVKPIKNNVIKLKPINKED